ncbi:hypothetical protein ACHAQA_005911 [Verticillium albo-atrum]
MYLSRLVATLTLALGVLAIPLDPSVESQEEKLPEGFHLCIEAENCEVYKLDNGEWSFRYVAGMEPGTDWYNEHANITDEIGPQQESALDTRQSSCDSSHGRTCTYIWVRPDRTLYGTLWPRTAVQA